MKVKSIFFFKNSQYVFNFQEKKKLSKKQTNITYFVCLFIYNIEFICCDDFDRL